MRRAIALSVIRLILHDPVVRLDVDPEGVHQARVATRRLRSDLRTFRSLVEPDFATALRDELGWLAAILGEVRDGDVLLERLRGRVAELPEDERAGTDAVLATLEQDRDAAHARLLETLRSARYVELLERLVRAANDPELSEDAEASGRSRSCRSSFAVPWHSLEKRVKALGESPTDEQLHQIRIRTKRVRYAADAVTPIVGKPAPDVRAGGRRSPGGSRRPPGCGRRGEVARRLARARSRAGRGPCRRDAGRRRARRGGGAPGGLASAWEKLAAPELRAWM